MKEKMQIAIAGMSFIALIVFFAIDKIPLEVFGPILTGALVWIYKDVEHERMIKRMMK